MEPRLSLVNLPPSSQFYIFCFLTPSELLTKVSLLNHSMFKLINESKYMLTHCILGLLGSSKELESLLSGMDEVKLSIVLERIKFSASWRRELPFFGFQSTGGVDSNRAFWHFDKIFAQSNLSPYTSHIRANFQVQGALAFDYFEVTNTIPNTYRLKKNPLEKVFMEYWDYFKTKRYSLASYMKEKATAEENSSRINLSYFPLDDIIGVMTEFTVKRPLFRACPIKTLMVFASTEPIESCDDPMIEVFEGISSPDRLCTLYQSHSRNPYLPEIFYTNIMKLKAVKQNKEDTLLRSADFAIFVNKPNRLSLNVRPAFWLRFCEDGAESFQIVLPNTNLFHGKYLLVKVLDAMGTPYSTSAGRNASIFSVSAKGFLMEKNEILLPFLKEIKEI